MTAFESQFLFARALLLILLYGFLACVGLVAWLDLKRSRLAPGIPTRGPAGRLVMLDAAGSDWPAGTVFELDSITVVGRDLDAGLALTDPTLSSRHAVLTHRDGAWWVEDLHSTNGTFLNGSRLPPEVPAITRSGDVVQFGAVRTRLAVPSS
jgi:hypothetical protein